MVSSKTDRHTLGPASRHEITVFTAI